MSLPEYEQLIKSTFRLQLKNIKDKDAKVLIKMCAWNSTSLPLYKKLFPKYKQIMSARNFASCFKSYLKMIGSLSTTWTFLAGNTRENVAHFPIPLNSPFWCKLRQKWEKVKLPTVEEVKAADIAANLEDYVTHKENYCLCILYEDLMEDPGKICR